VFGQPQGDRPRTRSSRATERTPQLIDALKLLTAKNVITDGEITALDDKGKSSFQFLQS
jgi:ATP-dependent DNA ligase